MIDQEFFTPPKPGGGMVGMIWSGGKVVCPGYRWDASTPAGEVGTGCFEAGRTYQRFMSSPRGLLLRLRLWRAARHPQVVRWEPRG
jgi:hypothetical protein